VHRTPTIHWPQTWLRAGKRMRKQPSLRPRSGLRNTPCRNRKTCTGRSRNDLRLLEVNAYRGQPPTRETTVLIQSGHAILIDKVRFRRLKGSSEYSRVSGRGGGGECGFVVTRQRARFKLERHGIGEDIGHWAGWEGRGGIARMNSGSVAAMWRGC
jgi:hypothetical protein